MVRRHPSERRWAERARIWGAGGLALLLGVPAQAASQAGVAAAVRGSCELTREAAVGRQVRGGEQILLGDAIESGPSSGMQILLLDETTFTLGADSSLVVDEFVYDPATSAGRVGVNVTKGVFRFVSGKVAKKNPSDVNLRLNGATVGIRGTMVAGRVGDTGSLVALLGPGLESNTADSRGSIVVSNAGVSVQIDRPGFATEIPGPGLPPTPPFALLPNQLDGLLLDLASGTPLAPQAHDAGTPGAPAPRQSSDDGPPPSKLAGQSTAAGGEFSKLGAGPLGGGPGGGHLAQAAAQDAQGFQEMLASFEQIQAIPAGNATYGPVAFALSGPGTSATATFDYLFDFGSMFGGGNVNLVTGAGFAGGDGDFPLIVDPYALSGPAEIQESGNIVFINSGAFPMPNQITVDYKFINTDKVAGKVAVQVQYTELGNTAVGNTAVLGVGGGGPPM